MRAMPAPGVQGWIDGRRGLASRRRPDYSLRMSIDRWRWTCTVVCAVSLCACASNAPCDAEAARAQLLALHADVMQAHRERDPELLMRSQADDFVMANRGEVSRPSLSDRQARFSRYLGSTRFTEYVDTIPPIVVVSDDASVGWVIAQVRARGSQVTSSGASEPFEFESAWIELYERQGTTWKSVGNISNFKP
jgi:hypothetical protein